MCPTSLILQEVVLFIIFFATTMFVLLMLTYFVCGPLSDKVQDLDNNADSKNDEYWKNR